jgi:hypothetical protein
MSFQMCLLQDAATDRKVAVNPQLVRIVVEDRPGLVEIVFDNECRVAIQGTVDEVVFKLQKAMW